MVSLNLISEYSRSNGDDIRNQDLRIQRPFGKAICEWCGGDAIFRVSVNLISEYSRYSKTGFANTMAIRKSDFRMVQRRRDCQGIREYYFRMVTIFGIGICEYNGRSEKRFPNGAAPPRFSGYP